MQDSDAVGRLLDTFVLSQIKPELTTITPKPYVYHLREHDGRHEIDLIIDAGPGKLVGLEIKASSRFNPHDARHLMWFDENTQGGLYRGIVFYTGQHIIKYNSKIWAIPIKTLWADA